MPFKVHVEDEITVNNTYIIPAKLNQHYFEDVLVSLLETAYNEALETATTHYENFPVVSLFLPKHLRKHVAVVYRFAREADDFADEGTCSPDERITKLNEYENKLSDALNGSPSDGFWTALKDTIERFNLSAQNFYDLLSAFKQDVEKKTYNDFDELKDYCRRSANPVGRIILEFFDIRDEESFGYSDAVCTALQITNFYQDVSVDYRKGRIYIPQDEIVRFGIDKNIFELKENNVKFQKLMNFQLNRASELFREGRKLIPKLPGKLKYQIKWTILGGEKILDKIKQIDYDVLNRRPKLSKIDYFYLMLKSLVM